MILSLFWLACTPTTSNDTSNDDDNADADTDTDADADADADADSDTDTDTDTDADTDACVSTGFATSVADWALPEGYPDSTFDTPYDDVPTDGLAWSVFDVGVGGVDLVVTASPDDAAVGTTKWLVHSNTGARFRANPVEVALPPDFEPGTFALPYDASTTDKVVWGLTDLDGDDRADIVVAGTDSGAGGIGTNRWLFYKNTEDGFAQASTNWTLPDGYDGALDTLSDVDPADGVNWALIDLTGDGKPDLVVSDTDADTATIGTSKWVLHKNTGSGFGAATDFSLPNDFEPDTFARFYDSSTTDKVVWGLWDFNDDGRPDIVVAGTDSGAGGIGATRWLVYANSGSAFSDSTNWTLPTGFPEGTLDALVDLDDDSVDWTLTYLNGDARPDLVVTQDTADVSVGLTEWRVYAGGARKIEEAASWTLPTDVGSSPFGALYDLTPTDGLAWTVMALDKDAAPDLVVTRNATDANVGVARWQLAAALCE